MAVVCASFRLWVSPSPSPRPSPSGRGGLVVRRSSGLHASTYRSVADGSPSPRGRVGVRGKRCSDKPMLNLMAGTLALPSSRLGVAASALLLLPQLTFEQQAVFVRRKALTHLANGLQR